MSRAAMGSLPAGREGEPLGADGCVQLCCFNRVVWGGSLNLSGPGFLTCEMGMKIVLALEGCGGNQRSFGSGAHGVWGPRPPGVVDPILTIQPTVC